MVEREQPVGVVCAVADWTELAADRIQSLTAVFSATGLRIPQQNGGVLILLSLISRVAVVDMLPLNM
jgi:hypothetical protein